MPQTQSKIQQLTIGQQVICLAFGGEVCTIEPTGIFWQGEVWDADQERHIRFDLHTGKAKDADFMPVVFPANNDFAQAVDLLTNAYEVTA